MDPIIWSLQPIESMATDAGRLRVIAKRLRAKSDEVDVRQRTERAVVIPRRTVM